MQNAARRLIVVLMPLVLLAACGWNGPGSTARLLDQRLQARLAAGVAANRVVVQPLPDGARVTFLDAVAEAGGLAASASGSRSSRASVLEALLDPTLMRVAIDDTAPVPDASKAEQISSLRRYFQDNALGSVLMTQPQPQVLPPGPPGVALTIRVVCPQSDDGAGYDTGKDKPACF